VEGLALAAVLAGFGAVVVAGMAQNAPFAWDEAVYALTTRHWMQGTPDTGWGPHRPPVLSVLGIVPLALGTDEWLFRVVGLVSGLGAIAAVWFLGRTLAGPAAGLLGALLVAGAPSIQLDAGLFLNDIPSTGLLVLLVALLWRTFESPRPPGWGLLWLAPLAAAAFYVRYGAIVPLLAIGLAMLIVWPRQLAVAWKPASAAVALLVLLLVPHAMFAQAATGSPFGIALLARGGAEGAFLGAGLVQYLAWLPSTLVGIVPGAAAVLGLTAGAYHLAGAALARRWTARARAYGLLVIPAVLQIGVLGLLTLPQARYIFLAMVLLVVAGGMAVVDLAAGLRSGRRAALAAAAAAAAVALTVSGLLMPGTAQTRAAFLFWQRQAGELIRAVGAGSCSVLASDVPQMTWYSGCPSTSFGDVTVADRDELLRGANRFLVLRRDGRFQPRGAVLREYRSRAEPDPVAVMHNPAGRPAATIYRFRPRPD
jgi:hypothetical protein